MWTCRRLQSVPLLCTSYYPPWPRLPLAPKPFTVSYHCVLCCGWIHTSFNSDSETAPWFWFAWIPSFDYNIVLPKKSVQITKLLKFFISIYFDFYCFKSFKLNSECEHIQLNVSKHIYDLYCILYNKVKYKEEIQNNVSLIGPFSSIKRQHCWELSEFPWPPTHWWYLQVSISFCCPIAAGKRQPSV